MGRDVASERSERLRKQLGILTLEERRAQEQAEREEVADLRRKEQLGVALFEMAEGGFNPTPRTPEVLR